MTMIRMPMDQELYDASVKVMDAIEMKLAQADRHVSKEDILGRDLAQAYQAWQTILVAKYLATEEPPEDPPTRRFFRR